MKIKNLKSINRKSIIFQSVILFCALFGVTGGYHRLFTHKSYEASSILRKILLIFGSSSLEGSVKDWCSEHRLHHIHDGKNKHRTVVGANVFVGSNSSLVAPLKIGDASIIAAGSTINRDVPSEGLAIARSIQQNKIGLGKKIVQNLQKIADKIKRD